MYPNGLQSTFTYDTQNRVTALSNAAANYTYTLDGTVGNRKGVTERLVSKPSPRIVAWNYDNIYRLTDENITADPNSKTGEVTYGLDPVGNRLSLGLSTGSNLPGISPIQLNSISYDHDDRLSTETYDPNGNTLTTGGKTFTYDFANRLKSMNGGAVTIQYDADGNRVAKTVNGVTTRYLVDDLNPTGYAQVVEEVTGTTAQRTYTYGLQRISQNQQIANAWTPSFYGYDGGGTVRLLSDSTGTVTDTYDYDAWGNTVSTTGTTTSVYLYRGEHYDPDLGLYYFRARYYNSLTGRFLTKDPAEGATSDPATLHKYLYAHDDPINRLDPSGQADLIEYTLLLKWNGNWRGQFKLPNAACLWLAGGGGSGGGSSGPGNLPPHPQLLVSAGPAGKVQICTRPSEGKPGRHAYFWDTRRHKACGMGLLDPRFDEDPTKVKGTVCVDIPGSAGKEDGLMSCCALTMGSVGWFPWAHDCHSEIKGCLEGNGIAMPPIPGGRIGSPPKCGPGVARPCANY